MVTTGTIKDGIMLRRVRLVAAPGAKFAVYDCIVVVIVVMIKVFWHFKLSTQT